MYRVGAPGASPPAGQPAGAANHLAALAVTPRRDVSYVIVLAEQNAKLVFDVRGMDLHQHLGVS